MIIATHKSQLATVCTHGGIFHADEVFATLIMDKLSTGNTYVIRAFKVPENLNPNAVVYDIGHGKYDHHQPGGNGCRENGVPYSSVGLIWRDFGMEVVKNTPNPALVWELIDVNLIQEIDAIDNGVLPKVNYPAMAMSINRMIGLFNPNWDDKEYADDAFIRAVEFAEIVFNRVLRNAISTARASCIVENAIDKSTGHIMVLDEFVPWQNGIFGSKNPKAKDIQFIVFPSLRGGFNWQCVPDKPGGFGQRKPTPKEWWGLAGEELQKVTEVETATFCHPNGFIGGAQTKEDAIRIAEIAASKKTEG